MHAYKNFIWARSVMLLDTFSENGDIPKVQNALSFLGTAAQVFVVVERRIKKGRKSY